MLISLKALCCCFAWQALATLSGSYCSAIREPCEEDSDDLYTHTHTQVSLLQHGTLIEKPLRDIQMLAAEVEEPVSDNTVKKILCVGDSITEGRSQYNLSYPGILQTLLGRDYNVTAVAERGAGVRKSLPNVLPGKQHSFWYSENLNLSMNEASTADIIVIMFGTNDAKGWENDLDIAAKEYSDDYSSLIHMYQQSPSRPLIYIAVPPPMYIPGLGPWSRWYLNHIIWVNDRLPTLIPKIAENNSLPAPIDFHSGFASECLDFQDQNCSLMNYTGPSPGIHPNANKGIELLARMVKSHIM